jgi:hypothetical protein
MKSVLVFYSGGRDLLEQLQRATEMCRLAAWRLQ